MDDIKFLEDWFNNVVNEKGIDIAIKYVQIKERQKYNYYCYCSDRLKSEECERYNKTWDWMIDKLNQYNVQTLTND